MMGKIFPAQNLQLVLKDEVLYKLSFSSRVGDLRRAAMFRYDW